MEQIVIRVQDKEKARALADLLRLLDFVDFVGESSEADAGTSVSDDDFFAMAGVWEGRDVSQATLREKAWPYRS